MCIFKTFSMQYRLDYYIERKNVHPLQKQIQCSVSAENAFCNIFLPPLRTDETVMCALTEYNWYFENLAYCLFNIPKLKDSIFLDTKLIFVYYIAIFVRVLSLVKCISTAIMSRSFIDNILKQNRLTILTVSCDKSKMIHFTFWIMKIIIVFRIQDFQ